METVEELIRFAGPRAVILLETDEPTEMARVSVNGEWVMQGNFWDFHPQCHRGLTQELAVRAFEWRGREALVGAIRSVLPKSTEVAVVRRAYSYATGGGRIEPLNEDEMSTVEWWANDSRVS